ncbi:MAG: Nif3-like dinuclear metal center hexameric protein [Trueperaceae bacterium]
MKRDALVRWLDDYLAIADYPDPSLNGLQLEGAEEVGKVAVAVDASLATFEKAAELGADFLIVHHGLFWGSPIALTGMHKKRVAFLLEQEISLYAAHIPLDAHREVGNNWGLAAILGLQELQDFAQFKGKPVGVKGTFKEPRPRRLLANLLEEKLGEPVMMLEGGPEQVETFGVVSGGAAWDVVTAANEGLDAFLTGEPRHELFHEAYERGINALFGGHYMTETVGVNLLAGKIRDLHDLPVEFIYLPTGL